MLVITTLEELVAHLREDGLVLWAPPPVSPDAQDRSIPADPPDFGGPRTLDLPVLHSSGEHQLLCAIEAGSTPTPDASDGLVGRRSNIVVSELLYRELCEEIQNDRSAIRRQSRVRSSAASCFGNEGEVPREVARAERGCAAR